MFAHSYDPFGLQQPPLSPHSYEKHKRQEIAKYHYRRTIEAQRRRQAELGRLALMEEKLNTDKVALRRKSEVQQWQLEEMEEDLRRLRLATITRGGTTDHHEGDCISYSNVLPSPYASMSRDELEDEFPDSYPPREIEVVLKPSDRLTSTSSSRPEKKQDTRRQHPDPNQHFDDDDDATYAPPHIIAVDDYDVSDDEEDYDEDLDSIWRNLNGSSDTIESYPSYETA